MQGRFTILHRPAGSRARVLTGTRVHGRAGSRERGLRGARAHGNAGARAHGKAKEPLSIVIPISQVLPFLAKPRGSQDFFKFN